MANKIMAIESSCDDFSVAVLDEDRIVYSKTISQKHELGVYPERAARMHAEHAWPVIQEAIMYNPNFIAVTMGPGLIGSLYVGVTIAKTLSMTMNAPLLAVNHVNAHILTPVWATNITFPYIALVISGGHTLLAKVESITDIQILGSTRDDAAGEAIDKSARILGLGYPGGPPLEKLAKEASNPVKLPIPMLHHKGYDFSFSGLKERFRVVAQNKDIVKADLAAGMQNAVSQGLIIKCKRAIEDFGIRKIALVGGVAANNKIRDDFRNDLDTETFFPPHRVCGDNAEMIAWCGKWKFEQNDFADLRAIPKARYKDCVW